MSKIKVTAQQRANAIEARDVMWPSVPPENVATALAFWRTPMGGKPDYGTIACFGGWSAVWPSFQAQGVMAAPESGRPLVDGSLLSSTPSRRLFGHYALFDGRSVFYEADSSFAGTDHELVTHRLNWLIENSEVVS